MDTVCKLLGFVPLCAIALWVPGTASADPRHSPGAGHGYHDAGPYIGGALGRSYIDTDLGDFGFDSDDTAYKLFLGFGFSDYVRLEAGYVDLGSLQETLDFGVIGIERVGFGADGPTLGLELGLPLGQSFSITARGGVMFWEAQAGVGGFGFRDKGEDPFYGIGLRYRMSPHVSLLGGAERYELEDLEVDVISLGVSFYF